MSLYLQANSKEIIALDQWSSVSKMSEPINANRKRHTHTQHTHTILCPLLTSSVTSVVKSVSNWTARPSL